MKRVNCARAITSSVGRQAMSLSSRKRSIIFQIPFSICHITFFICHFRNRAANSDDKRKMQYGKWKMKAPHVLSSRFANIRLLPNRMQPVMVFRPSSGDDVEERLLDRFRDGAARACPDGAPVDFADRRD